MRVHPLSLPLMKAKRLIKDRYPVLAKNFRDNKNETIRTLLISGGFGFCFSLSCVLGYKLDRFGTAFGSPLSVLLGLIAVLIIAGAIAVVGVIVSAGVVIGNRESKSKTILQIDKSKRGRVWLISSLVLVFAWIPIYLAYFPAVFSYDAEAQLAQVIMGSYNTHHPLIHTLIMGGCVKSLYDIGGINLCMAVYAGVQLSVMAIIVGFAYSEALRIGISRIGAIVYGGFMCLFPVHGILAISTTKDVYFSGLVLIFILLLRRIIYENERFDLFKLGVVTVLLLLFRNNAQYALVLLILIYAFLLPVKKKAVLMTLIISVVCAGMIGAGLKVVLNAESGSPREALSIPIQQMARVSSLYTDDIPQDLMDDLRQIIDEEASAKYDAHLADPVKERVSMKQPVLFVKTWIRLGLRYPGAYVDAWLLTTEGAWYLGDKSCNRIYGEGVETGFGYLSTDIRSMPEGFQVSNLSVIPALRDRLEYLVSGNSFEKLPIIRVIFAPALYFWLLVGLLYMRIVRREYRDVNVLLFLFLYYLTILMSPAILVRYMYPYMLALIFVFIRTKEHDYS